MSAAIDFYFDFSSPYSYLAAQEIDKLASAHGRSVEWRPMLLGALFKTTGGVPLVDVPLKGAYAIHDFKRSARYSGVPFRMPSAFPISTVNSARATLWVKAQTPARTADFVRAVFKAYFVDDRNINDVDQLAAIASEIGLDAEALRAAVADPAIKDALRVANEDAVAHGVCGAPFILVDNEPFWGNDRLPQLKRWLTEGGF